MLKVILWICHEDSNTRRKNAQYDMIIGADLLSELGIEINFNTQRIIWEGIEIPMKDKNIISDLQKMRQLSTTKVSNQRYLKSQKHDKNAF